MPLQHREEGVGLRLLVADRRHDRGVTGGEGRGHHDVELEDSGFDEAGVGDRGRGASDGDGRKRGQ